MKRTFCILAIAAGLVGSLAATAMAGRWAVATFDETPATLEVGTAYTLGYTIRAHGVTPIDAGATEIRFLSDGETLVFAGVPTDKLGHYTAEVTVPATGEWRWEVTLGGQVIQDLGTIPVSGVPEAATTVPAAATTDVLRIVLPLATLLSAGLALFQLRPSEISPSRAHAPSPTVASAG